MRLSFTPAADPILAELELALRQTSHSMSRIEELPDDFDESLDLNALTAGHSVAELEESYARRFNKSPSTGADNSAPKSFEEIMSDISQTPLFMNSDDVAGEAGTP